MKATWVAAAAVGWLSYQMRFCLEGCCWRAGVYIALAPAVAAARNRAGGEPGHGAQAGLKWVGLATAVEMLRQRRGQCVGL